MGMSRSGGGRRGRLWYPGRCAATLAPRMAVGDIETERRPMTTGASGGHGRCQAIAVATAKGRLPRSAHKGEGGGLPLAVGVVVGRCNVLEGDAALDVLTGKDGILVPVHKDADVSRGSGGGGGGGVGRHRCM
jgi:hypothetical protein